MVEIGEVTRAHRRGQVHGYFVTVDGSRRFIRAAGVADAVEKATLKYGKPL